MSEHAAAIFACALVLFSGHSDAEKVGELSQERKQEAEVRDCEVVDHVMLLIIFILIMNM